MAHGALVDVVLEENQHVNREGRIRSTHPAVKVSLWSSSIADNRLAACAQAEFHTSENMAAGFTMAGIIT